MGRSQQRQKVIKYIRQDRPHRLESYVKKHRVDLSDVLLEGGGNLLHLSCAVASGALLSYLLKENIDPLHKDGFGNIPLHVLIHRALGDLNKGGNSYSAVYTEMILPYSASCPAALQKKTRAGKTAQTLLDGFLCQWEQVKDRQSFAGPSRDDDDEWEEKLRDECDNEYNMNGGIYEQDYTYTSSHTSESYDDWAERLTREHRRKRHTAYTHTQRPAPPLHKKSRPAAEDFTAKQQKYQEELNREREKLKRKYRGDEARVEEGRRLLRQKRSKYEEHFNELTQEENSSAKELGYEDIPWPHEGSVSMVMDVLFVDSKKNDKTSFRKYLRDQILRWHPDKFEQKFGRCLKPDDKDKILSRVKEISQALNSMASSGTSKY